MAHKHIRVWTRLATAAAVAAALLATASVEPAQAQTITVTTTAEAPGGAGDCTLGEAIEAANTGNAVDGCPAGSGDDIIVLSAGATYTLTTASASDNSALLISRLVTLQGHGARLTHNPLSGRLRFFTMTASSRLTLVNLSLIGGRAQGANGADGASDGVDGTPGEIGRGGAIFSAGGEIVLDGVTFSNNRALGGQGGAGFAGATPAVGAAGGAAVGGAIRSVGAVSVHSGGARFSGNQALGGKGGKGGLLVWTGGIGGHASAGAIYANHLDATNGLLTVEHSLAQGGEGGSGTPSGPGGLAEGGGLFMSDGSLSGAIFNDNRAQGGNAGDPTLAFNPNIYGGGALGGGIYAVEVTLTSSRLISNMAQGGAGPNGGLAQGGGLVDLGSIPITLLGDVILSNTANGGQGYDASGVGGLAQGGGVMVFGGQLSLVQSALVGNAANGGLDAAAATTAPGDGGGLYLNATGGVTNTTFALNHAGYGGGMETEGATVELAHVTVISNSASLYAAIYGNNIFMRNSIVAYHAPLGCSGGVFALGANLQYPDGTCGLLPVADPRLLPVADNGGQTLTAALRAGSPALDAADMAYCPPTDQRGYKRPAGAGCDLGAYERWFDTFVPLLRR